MNDTVASFAHDLRNKVNIVIANLELFEKKMESGLAWIDTKTYFEKSTKTLLTLTEFLDDMVNHHIEVEVSLNDLIIKAIETFKMSPLFIDYQVIASPIVTVNKVHIDRVISNIIQNSIEQNATSLQIILRKNSISFHDNGGGINSEVLLKIKSGSKASTKTQGHGLGLFSLKDLCEKHHWKLELQNRSRHDCHPVKNGLFIMITFPKPASHE
ncbi:MAG: hypothetical protein COW00_12980 [Bdellovibrio sp. CG12_big_fil_rev_8_21_14_0_65_39_13]|nr:MAG: hypothetical protein COW78_05300 [Bdellovibrio sp. CG22_combo_CG10-13_8_21_14_all_39_27]PIQ58994.1 MAG: hypothetical protein COW00_12980 [Bdellovibrio sp. CG12_big_fil_rev_8_21_14_0_65_39_13]PIR33961.1 MAG: hypothetical protein COV37_14695 [Bdellovibrio sp. CG11_big_fil_rev_8_21_14_0_20_39_38]